MLMDSVTKVKISRKHEKLPWAQAMADIESVARVVGHSVAEVVVMAGYTAPAETLRSWEKDKLVPTKALMACKGVGYDLSPERQHDATRISLLKRAMKHAVAGEDWELVIAVAKALEVDSES